MIFCGAQSAHAKIHANAQPLFAFLPRGDAFLRNALPRKQRLYI
jgi:hypothetical protein